MTEVIEMMDPVTGEIIDQQQITEQLQPGERTGRWPHRAGRLLRELTTMVWETALAAGATEHLGCSVGAFGSTCVRIRYATS